MPTYPEMIVGSKGSMVQIKNFTGDIEAASLDLPSSEGKIRVVRDCSVAKPVFPKVALGTEELAFGCMLPGRCCLREY